MKELKTLDDYIDWIYDRGPTKGKHTLKNITKLMEEFGNPQDKIKVIHVAGTNGKGSTCNFIANTLSKTCKCGLFISPYMEKITESIKINGVQMTEEEFIKYIDELRPVVERLEEEGYHNTYFEVLTAIMYKYFYDNKVDVAVVEVGLGGTLDSTNIIKSPIASVIVTISMDHVGILGSTIEEIAGNKGGIIKEGCPVFVYPQEEKVLNIFKAIAKEKNSPLYTFAKDEVKVLAMKEDQNEFSFRNYNNMKTKLVGVHQLYNASLAISLLDFFKADFGFNKDLIKEAIYETQNIGRLQIISKKPKVLVDGSHNAEAITVLTESLKAFHYDKLILGFSMLKDKDYKYSIRELSKLADKMVITTIDNPDRAFTLEELKAEVEKVRDDAVAIDNRIEAYEYTKQIAGENDLILWCGSLYLIRELINYEKTK